MQFCYFRLLVSSRFEESLLKFLNTYKQLLRKRTEIYYYSFFNYTKYIKIHQILRHFVPLVVYGRRSLNPFCCSEASVDAMTAEILIAR